MRLRKLLTLTEETRAEQGRTLPPARRALAAAVIDNPLAGRWAEDLGVLIDMGATLGDLLGRAARDVLGGPAQSYGKAALVGEAGEIEHAAALLHPAMGAPLRAVLGGGAALVPSAKAQGGPGAMIEVPLGHKDAAYVRSHFDAMRLVIPDAPRAGEIVVAIALSDRGRPAPRVGGLRHEEITGQDGLR